MQLTAAVLIIETGNGPFFRQKETILFRTVQYQSEVISNVQIALRHLGT